MNNGIIFHSSIIFFPSARTNLSHLVWALVLPRVWFPSKMTALRNTPINVITILCGYSLANKKGMLFCIGRDKANRPSGELFQVTSLISWQLLCFAQGLFDHLDERDCSSSNNIELFVPILRTFWVISRGKFASYLDLAQVSTTT